jgi:hypothetical protein
VSGDIVARYVGEENSYRTYRIQTPNRGSIADSPPLRCEGTFRIMYALSLRDASGQTVSRNAQASVVWVC